MALRGLIVNVAGGAALVTLARVWIGGPAQEPRTQAPPAGGTEVVAVVAPARAAPATVATAGANAGAAAVPGAELVRTSRALVAEYLGDTALAAPDVRVRLRTLLVVLPDPIDSRLDWTFDGGIESVRRALEGAGYVLDRFWLPWQVDADSTRLRRGQATALRHVAPGVLVFKRKDGPAGGRGRPAAARGAREPGRGAPDTVGLVVVHVVGETPTAGVWPAAFRAALADRDTLAAALARSGVLADPAGERARRADTLRVVGPIFSGSVESLRRGLAHWLDAAPTARRALVVSGGATVAQNQAVLRQDARVAFAATVNPVDSVLAVVDSVLVSEFRIPLDRVAYVREASTRYGAQLAATDRAPGRRGTVPLDLPFPMSISRLRAEYARRGPTGGSAPPAPGALAPSRIPLDLGDPASAAENLPTLSELTAPAIERTLDDMAGTLLAHRIRAVVIVATDVRDRIFLADEVKRRLRDVKIVLVGSHALYLRPEVNESLRGTIVVASYPLFLESQYWDRSRRADRTRLVFTSDLTEGTFNAALFQLGDTAYATDYAFPHDTTLPLRPPVWVTIVGRTSLLPVTARALRWQGTATCGEPLLPDVRAAYVAPRCDAVTARRLAVARALAPGEPPGMGFDIDDAALWLLLVAGMLSTIGTVRMASGLPAFTPRFGWRLPVRAPRVRWYTDGHATVSTTAEEMAPAVGGVAERVWAARAALLDLHQSAWASLRLVALVGAVTPIGVAVLRPGIHGNAPPLLGALALALLAAAAVGIALVEHALREERSDAAARTMPAAVAAEVGHGRRQCALLLAVGFLYALVTASLLWRIAMLAPAGRGMFLTRALQFTSGVTPLVPLCIGGLLLVAWASWHLRRAGMLRVGHALDATLSGFEPDDGTRGASDGSDVRAALLSVTRGPAARAIWVAFALLAAWTVARLERAPEVLALGAPVLWGVRLPSEFDVLYRGLLVSAFGLIGWSLYRLAATWGALRCALRRIAAAPIQGAFARLPAPVASLARLTPFDTPAVAQVEQLLDGAARDRWRTVRGDPMIDLPALLDPLRAHGMPAEVLATDGPPLRGDLPLVPALGDVYAALLHRLAGPDRRSLAGRAARAAAEELAALHVVAYVGWCTRHLRHLAYFLLAALTLTTLLLACYPFEPQSLLKAVFFTLMALSVGSVLSILVQMNRDVVLSRIARTTEGKVTWDFPFVLNLLVVIAVPLVTLLGSQFPEVRDFVFGWVNPILKMAGRS